MRPRAPFAAEALRLLPAGYPELYQRVLAAAEADYRIRAMWLAGSLGRGVADGGSDLDVVIAIAAGSLDEFAASWQAWLAGVTPSVLAKDLAGLPGSFYSITPGCLRLDVVAERAGSASAKALAGRLLVLVKDGDVPAETSGADEQAPGPDGARLAGITEEFFRQLAIFPAAFAARGDWLLGVVGVCSNQMMLYQLFVDSNQPLPPMGIKRWSAKLTPAAATDLCRAARAERSARERASGHACGCDDVLAGGQTDPGGPRCAVAGRVRWGGAALPGSRARLGTLRL